MGDYGPMGCDARFCGGLYTRVENVICGHRVACSGNWEGDLDLRMAVWVHFAACVLHFRRGWDGQFINMGNLGKVMVVGLSAVFGAWMYALGLGLGILLHYPKE